MANRRTRPAPAPRKKPNEAFLANLTGAPTLKKAEASDQVLSGQRIETTEETPAAPRQLSVAPSIPAPAVPEPAADAGKGSVTSVASHEGSASSVPAAANAEADETTAGGGEAPIQSSPVPPTQEEVAEPAPAPRPDVVQSPPADPAVEQAPSPDEDEQGSEADKPARQRKVKVTIMMVEAEVERMRSAFVHLPYEARAGSLSQWASRALMDQVRAAEDEYNGGQPWPPIQKGAVPVGRPVGS